MGTVDFLGRGMSVETFFKSVPILADGLGNFFVLDAQSRQDSGGPVLFWCHDPPVAVVQAPTLAGFIEQVLSGDENALTDTREQATMRIWSGDPYLVPVEQARESDDVVVAAFAKGLPDGYGVADLRK